MDNTTKQHYFMVAGYLTFMPIIKGEVPSVDAIQKAHMNSVVSFEAKEGVSHCWTTKNLIKAQQAMQIQLHNKVQGTEVNVLDLTFTSLMYLGLMTPAEFLDTPEAANQAEL